MKDEVYIVSTSHGVQRLTKRPPYLARDEIAVKLRIAIPDSAFSSPVLTVNLDVPDTAVVQPTVDLEVIEPVVATGGEV